MKIMRRVDWVSFAIVSGLLLGSLGTVWFLGNAEAQRAQAAMSAQEYTNAFISYARAAQFLPWRDDLHEKAGVAAGMSGDFDAALSYLNGLSTLSERGWVVLAYAHAQQGDLAAALTVYEAGLQNFPTSAPLYSGLGTLYRIQKDWANEKKALEDQILYDEENVHAHYRLGLLASFLEPERALEHLTRAAALNPQLDPAVETMRSALNIASTQEDESQKLVTIGRALGLVQEWSLARSVFQEAVTVNAENAEAWAWLGEAEQQTGADGSEALDQAIALDKQSAIVRALRGLQWNRMGDYDRMLAEYSLAARIEPGNPAWQVAMGEAHLKLGDLAAALGNYTRATELAPEEALYWRLLAVICAENGVAVEEVALPAAQKAVELAPKDPTAWDALGLAYFSSGRYANAEESLKKAIELDVNYYAAYIHLAMNYLTQGNNPAAYDALIYVRDHDRGAYAERAKELLAQYFP
jgi:tetratricopeptide (TPR) repeat protein